MEACQPEFLKVGNYNSLISSWKTEHNAFYRDTRLSLRKGRRKTFYETSLMQEVKENKLNFAKLPNVQVTRESSFLNSEQLCLFILLQHKKQLMGHN